MLSHSVFSFAGSVPFMSGDISSQIYVTTKLGYSKIHDKVKLQSVGVLLRVKAG